MNEYDHIPVLLNEVLKGLNLRPDGFYVDCTFGRGGHSRAILQALDKRGRLLVIDKDIKAIEYAREKYKNESRLICVHGSFTSLLASIEDLKMTGRVDGLLLDLGVSSPQLDDENYGFSFVRDGNLDMRMDSSTGMTAADWINKVKFEELEKVIRVYGEERFARRISRAIIKYRQETPITRTLQLAKIIAEAVPSVEREKNPATRTFQAIRIHINNELEELKQVLGQVQKVLRPGGRLVVISFHSLEDRIVKQFMQNESKGDDFPPDVPVTSNKVVPRLKIITRVEKPGIEEINRNPRARSAILRVGEKLAA